MEISVMIIDDSPEDISTLESMLFKAAGTLGIRVSARRVTEPDNSLDVNENMVFVDVMMPGIKGTELIPQLRAKADPNTLFVLMSSQHAFIKAGYSVEAFDFLCKPFDQQDVTDVLRRALERIKMQQRRHMIIHVDRAERKILFNDILAITVNRNYATMITVRERLCFRDTLRRLMNDLPPYFVRISGNTMINVLNASAVMQDYVIMREGRLTLDVARNYHDSLTEAFIEMR